MKKNLANIITLTRIIGTLTLFFMEEFSLPFLLVYIWCGISDVLDGFVARKLKIASAWGSRLDTVSDLLYYTVMMVKILPYLYMYLPSFMWILIYSVLALRALIYIFIFIRDKKLNSRHTILNKITGAMMFFLYFFVRSKYLVYYASAVLAVAYAGTFEEIIHLFKHAKEN